MYSNYQIYSPFVKYKMKNMSVTYSYNSYIPDLFYLPVTQKLQIKNIKTMEELYGKDK